jgi:hypothetical protein
VPTAAEATAHRARNSGARRLSVEHQAAVGLDDHQDDEPTIGDDAKRLGHADAPPLATLRLFTGTAEESVFRRSQHPHDLTGLQARLAAKAALHNFCLWLNAQLGRDRLAFADLIAW